MVAFVPMYACTVPDHEVIAPSAASDVQTVLRVCGVYIMGRCPDYTRLVGVAFLFWSEGLT